MPKNTLSHPDFGCGKNYFLAQNLRQKIEKRPFLACQKFAKRGINLNFHTFSHIFTLGFCSLSNALIYCKDDVLIIEENGQNLPQNGQNTTLFSETFL